MFIAILFYSYRVILKSFSKFEIKKEDAFYFVNTEGKNDTAITYIDTAITHR